MLDFQPWNELLHRYVNEGGLVDYRAWQRSPQQLTEWLQQLSQTNLEQLSNSQQLALWLNLYNALVVRQILKRYPIETILPRLLGIPNWIAFWAFFSRPVYKISGDRYSLNNVEHDILRQKFSEPRIHFALVCAAAGCPLLRNEAYTPENVTTQLDEDARRFINNPDKVYYDREREVLFCSKIFKWYQRDFLQAAESIPQYIQTYLATDLPLNAAIPVKYLDYDWSLNQRISS